MKVKWFALLIIMIGLLLTSYPLILLIETKYEQKSLKEELDNTSPQIEVSQNKGQKHIPEVNWDSWKNTLLVIPKLSLEVVVVDTKDMAIFAEQVDQPPSHYPGTAFPGQIGNVAIAGHNSGPAGYFRNLHKLLAGDIIFLQTENVSYEYEVEKTFVTDKKDWSVIDPTDYPSLTLTTCQAEGMVSNAKRLIVRAKLVVSN